MPTVATPTTNLFDQHFGNGGADNVLNQQLEPNTGYARIHVSKSDFTDGLGASGTYVTPTNVMPIGCYANGLATLYVVKAATGDTTAVITAGDGTDVDRYVTGTPSIFTAGFVDMHAAGVASGTVFHSAAKAVTLTVTGGSDFTALDAFEIIICIPYTKA